MENREWFSQGTAFEIDDAGTIDEKIDEKRCGNFDTWIHNVMFGAAVK